MSARRLPTKSNAKLFVNRLLGKRIWELLLSGFRRLRCLCLAGNRFECPFCSGRFRRFLPDGLTHQVLEERDVVGGGSRENTICPRCFSRDRERLAYLYLANETPIVHDQVRILHVAPERLLERKLRAYNNIDILCVDLNPEPLREAIPSIQHMDVANIDATDNSFDIIICNHVLEHVPDDRAAMRELLRVLKPGGWAMLQVPIARSLEVTLEDSTTSSEQEREKMFGQRDHVRMFGRDYADRLTDAGFDVKLFHWSEESGYGGSLNQHALIRDEVLHIAKKKVTDQ